VIGQDQYAGFHTWQGWQELLARTTLAIAARPDAGTAVDPRLRAAVPAVVALPMMDVSSTEIRQRIRAGQGITDLVPPAVASYSARHHLYQDPPQGDPARELNGHS
jgi:nicotinate-nucleotide adenylyltransferase